MRRNSFTSMATDIEDWLIAWFKRRNPTAIIDMTNDYYCSGLVDSFGIIELIGDLEKIMNQKKNLVNEWVKI